MRNCLLFSEEKIEKHIPGSIGEVCEGRKTPSEKNIQCIKQAQIFSGKPTIESLMGWVLFITSNELKYRVKLG